MFKLLENGKYEFDMEEFKKGDVDIIFHKEEDVREFLTLFSSDEVDYGYIYHTIENENILGNGGLCYETIYKKVIFFHTRGVLKFYKDDLVIPYENIEFANITRESKNIEDLLAKYVHDLWSQIKSFTVDIGRVQGEEGHKELVIPEYKLSEWIYDINADFSEDLFQEEKWSDYREAKKIIKLLEDNGYEITKKLDK